MNQTECTELVLRAQAGDALAFEALAEDCRYRLTNCIRQFLANDEDVEDATQQALLNAYRGLPAFRHDAQFFTWLYRIGFNVAMNMLKAQSRHAHVSLELVETELDGRPDFDTPEGIYEAKQTVCAIARRIDHLPTEQRQALQLSMVGFNYRQIAKIMRCPRGTVASRLNRASLLVEAELDTLLTH